MFRTSIHNRATRILSSGLLCLACAIASSGCVSIQSAPKLQSGPTSMNISNAPVDDCQLYDRSEAAKQWMDRLSPRKLVPGSVSDWVCESKQKSSDWIAERRFKHESRKASMHAWIQRKKEDANQPPWPRFHPLPAKPVFEPSEETLPMDPDIYGRFGKSE